MALTQVRARLGEEWVTLTLNPATGRYEGYLTPPGTSIHQEGGYFPVTVEAANDAGQTDTLSGERYPNLRLVVRETTAPVLTLISPVPGWLTTQTPAIVFQAVDEEGGSGVDPESFSLDGAEVEEINSGYRFTWTPPEPWADGAHTVTASVRDYDGNLSTVSAAYQVDTVPPVLYLRLPDAHRVVDADHITLSGWARDATSGVADISVGVEGPPPAMQSMALPPLAGGAKEPIPVGPDHLVGSASQAENARSDPPGSSGPTEYMEFSQDVHLAIGENYITVTAVDGAGLAASQTVYVIRLVTDRTVSDLDTLREMYRRGADSWTEEERTWFLTAPCLRGSYDAQDLNRVGTALRYLAGELERRGYIAQVSPQTGWKGEDAPNRTQMERYLRDVMTVRDAQNLYVEAQPPATMRFSGVNEWNAIEKALVEADSYFPRYFSWQSGNLQCGAF